METRFLKVFINHSSKVILGFKSFLYCFGLVIPFELCSSCYMTESRGPEDSFEHCILRLRALEGKLSQLLGSSHVPGCCSVRRISKSSCVAPLCLQASLPVPESCTMPVLDTHGWGECERERDRDTHNPS